MAERWEQSRTDRGECPVCQRSMQLKRDGTVRAHVRAAMLGRSHVSPHGGRCPGSGQRPHQDKEGRTTACQPDDVQLDPVPSQVVLVLERQQIEDRLGRSLSAGDVERLRRAAAGSSIPDAAAAILAEPEELQR